LVTAHVLLACRGRCRPQRWRDALEAARCA
jgi:hypothetical protein